MIIDKLENRHLYSFGEAWEKAFTFLETLTPASEEGKYAIEGEDIFAIVMRYETASPEGKLFESHREYVDIQTVLSGSEGFECAFTDGLAVEMPYDAAKEAALYRRQTPGTVRVDVVSGSFVMLWPHDAHLAGLMTGKLPEQVKKVVVKVRRGLLDNNSNNAARITKAIERLVRLQ